MGTLLLPPGTTIQEKIDLKESLIGKSIVSINDLSKEQIELIMESAACIKEIVIQGKQDILKGVLSGKSVSIFFYEPSSRTAGSFEWATKILGGYAKVTSHAGVFSSAAKGESLEDSIIIEGLYSDFIVLRHPEKGSAKRAAVVSDKPIINAGDGDGEHPTQALLDLFSASEIRNGEINGLKIALMGDIKFSRTNHSLIKLLDKYNDVTIFLISPNMLRLSEDIKNSIKNVKLVEIVSLEAVLNIIDILYMTRTQTERFKRMQKAYARFLRKFAWKDRYKINYEIISPNKDLKVMHPLPRKDELSKDIDSTLHNYYFQQADNGKYVRAALLGLISGNFKSEHFCFNSLKNIL